MGFLSREQLDSIGFADVGENVLISDKASIYNPEKISVGSHVRVDDFCVLSAGAGGIKIGDYVHVAVFALLIGGGRITLEDFSGISSRVSIYSSNDDYSGCALTNPMVAEEFTNVKVASVTIGKHVIIGSGTIVLPGVTVGKGAAIGALSLVTKDCEEFTIYSGRPIKAIKARRRDLEALELKFLKSR